MVPTNDNDWAEILDVVAVESVEEEEEEPDEDEEDAHPHNEEYQLLVAIYPVPSVQRHPVLPPEGYILDGDRLPGLLLLPAVVVGVVHVLDGESVAGQAVPREAAQHRLDGAVLGLLERQRLGSSQLPIIVYHKPFCYCLCLPFISWQLHDQ